MKAQTLPQLTGKIKGTRLTVIKYSHKDKRCRVMLFKCDCGNYKKIRLQNVVAKSTKSCGCLIKEERKNGTTNKRMDVPERLENLRKAKKENPQVNKGNKKVEILVDGEIKHTYVKPSEVKKYEDKFMRELTALYYGFEGEVTPARQREAPNKGKKFIEGRYV